jgi:ABC-type multidrug transport system ATPase subunit
MNVVEFKNVFFAYRKDEYVIDNLELKVKKGEIHGLLGHNGAGKTTIFRLIVGLLKPKKGSITFFSNMSYNNNSIDFISYMPETRGIYEKLNVVQNLEFRGLAEGLSMHEVKSRSSELLDKFMLNVKKNELAGYLSHGLQKRLSLSCALIKKPQLLLLDEPTNGIDPSSLKIISNFLKELNKNGTTIFISSHDLTSISKLCSSVTIIQNGRSIYNGKISDIGSLEDIYLEKTGI